MWRKDLWKSLKLAKASGRIIDFERRGGVRIWCTHEPRLQGDRLHGLWWRHPSCTPTTLWARARHSLHLPHAGYLSLRRQSHYVTLPKFCQPSLLQKNAPVVLAPASASIFKKLSEYLIIIADGLYLSTLRENCADIRASWRSGASTSCCGITRVWSDGRPLPGSALRRPESSV